MILAECDRVIDAPVSVVWKLLTTAAGLEAWMAAEAVVDARPGGTITWRHDNGEVVAGEVVEVVAERRFVFTYGWASGFLPVPPGSTTVTVQIEPAAVGTSVSIRHEGLTAELAERHAEGWNHFLDRLVVSASEARR